MTTAIEPAAVRTQTLEQAALLLAAGLDPRRCTVYVQSHVPAHAELLWLLEATAHDGELRRMIQYKEKSASQASVRAALLSYPVLMAADILLYDVGTVPVGDDQVQHLELARTLAARFNAQYGDTFVVPRPVLAPVAARVMDLRQPDKKMSKSAPAGSAGVIRLLDPPATIRRKLAGAVTDSGNEVEFDPAAQPGVANLLTILAACSGTDVAAAAAGLTSYRELKEACADAVVGVLGPLQQRHAEFAADPAALRATFRDGAARMRDLAAPRLAAAKQAIGLIAP